ncbi:MAG TPA: S9 family peptidase, partial [Novosphingobium sp.]|nr:S9 family peptidase [Novosphingobium sp.]
MTICTGFRALWLAGSAAALTIGAPLHAEEVPARSFATADVFAIQQAADPQISPDGTRIVYTRLTGDIMTDSDRASLWLVDVASGEQQPLLPDGARQPRWSPDGKRIAYVGKDSGG